MPTEHCDHELACVHGKPTHCSQAPITAANLLGHAAAAPVLPACLSKLCTFQECLPARPWVQVSPTVRQLHYGNSLDRYR